MWGAKQHFTVQYAFCVAPTTCLYIVLMYIPGIAPGVVITHKQWPMLYKPAHTDHHCTLYKRRVANTQCTISHCAAAAVHGAGGQDELVHNRIILAIMEPVANLVCRKVDLVMPNVEGRYETLAYDVYWWKWALTQGLATQSKVPWGNWCYCLQGATSEGVREDDI